MKLIKIWLLLFFLFPDALGIINQILNNCIMFNIKKNTKLSLNNYVNTKDWITLFNKSVFCNNCSECSRQLDYQQKLNTIIQMGNSWKSKEILEIQVKMFIFK